jgi:O-antigen ligase
VLRDPRQAPRTSPKLGGPLFNTCVFAYAMTVPLEEISLPGGERLPLVAGLLLGGVVLARVLADATAFRVHIPWLTLSLLYLGVVTASYSWSVDQEITISRIGTLVYLLAISLIIACGGGPRTPVAGVLGLAAGGTVVAVESVRAYAQNVSTNALEVRVTTFDLDPNDAAAMLGIAAVGTLGIGLSAPRLWRALPLLALAAFLGASALLTASRTGLLAMVLGVAVVMWQSRHRLGYVVGLVAAGSVLGWTLVSSLDPRIIERLAGTGAAVESGDFNLRQYLWAAAIDGWSRRPVVGWGAGTERYAVEQFSSFSMVTHNTWLAVLTETGVLGFAVFVSLWLVALPRPGTARFERTLIWSILVPLMVATFSLSLEYRKITWLVLALCVVASMQRGAAAGAGTGTTLGGLGLPARSTAAVAGPAPTGRGSGPDAATAGRRGSVPRS